MKKVRTVDVSMLFKLAEGFLNNRTKTHRVTGNFGFFRAQVSIMLGRIALYLTTAAFRILPKEQPLKLPNTLVRPALLEMATEKLPDRKVDSIGYAGPQSFSPVTLSRPVSVRSEEIVDRDLAEMRGDGLGPRKTVKK